MTDSLRGRVLHADTSHLALLVHDGSVRSFEHALAAPPPVGALVSFSVHGTRVLECDVAFTPLRDPFSREGECGTDPSQRVRRLAWRARVIRSIRDLMHRESFLEVETPQCVRSPGLDVHLDAFDVTGRNGAVAGHLITSPEYHMKRLLVAGVGRCFSLAHCFRDDEHGPWHEPEFTMLEWYQPWEPLDALFTMTEAIVCEVARNAVTPGVLERERVRVPVRAPFARRTMREVFHAYAPDLGDPVDLVRRDEAAFHHAMLTRIEPHLGHDEPVFLHRYPSELASLARRCEDDPTVCERFELYVAGVELCNGFGELNDPVEQRARFEHDHRERIARGLPAYPIDERFLNALECGMPPAVGNALGVDRLLALAAGTNGVAGVMAFPRVRA